MSHNVPASVKKHLLKTVLSFIVFLSVALLLQKYIFADWFTESFWRELAPSSLSMQFAFIAMAALSTMLGFPRQVIAFVAGYSLGFWYGTLLATASTLLGCMLCYSFATKLSKHFQLANKYRLIQRLSAFLASDVFYKTLIIRLFPVGSNLLTNLAAGISQVNKLAFFSASCLGYLPQMIIFSLSGSGINLQSKWQLLLSGVLLCISLLLSIWLYRKEQNQLHVNPFIQQK
ncbi:VTT domain-containing protein [Thalassotalea litorea]|uniref:TVP38/TMEM64 family membrane protein n=1 Tax=Thalassotalea litorea TaxID=2020715 RepID=A0A5R9IIL8_9GAMM|nr:VTT domain-containing protein [Thalassotalea litorea]TLU65394.1 VTT domain-containing protein [Thalassotalea litorea]